MKKRNVFTSKKFGAFFTSLCALSLNSWYVLSTPDLSMTQAGVVSLIAFGIVALCLGFVLPEAKYDKAMGVLQARAEQPVLASSDWMDLKMGPGKTGGQK